MSRRKLRFDTRKKYARKKSTVPIAVPSSATLCISVPSTIYTAAPVPDAQSLYKRLTQLQANVLPKEWTCTLLTDLSLAIHKLDIHPPPLVSASVSYILTVCHDLSWTLHVGRKPVNLASHGVPHNLQSIDRVISVLSTLKHTKLCVGNADEKFEPLVTRHDGKFMDQHGKNLIASLDDELLPYPTIRHTNCDLLIPSSHSDRCLPCEEYRKTLHALASRQRVQSTPGTSSHTNFRYLTTSEKISRLQDFSHRTKISRLAIERLKEKEKLASLTETHEVTLDEDTSCDFQKIMDDEDSAVKQNYPEGSFQQLFWEQQREASSRPGRGRRWHPLMIKWCIYLRHLSSKAYETIRESGVIILPSQRTLRDYTNCVKARAGFSAEVDEQLMQAAELESCHGWQKLVILLLDEMHIREDLVYDKHTGRMIGFVNLGDINNHLLAFESQVKSKIQKEEKEKSNNNKKADKNEEEKMKSESEKKESDKKKEKKDNGLAKTMMAVMVRGLFTPLRFAYAHFACDKVTGELLFHPFWEAVYRLERMGLKVLGATFDGASVNRRLVKLHDTKCDGIHKVRNIHAPDKRDLFFFSDPPHLMKTTRNCWSSKTRSLWNNGHSISWDHLVALYEHDKGKCSGLAIVPKLKFEHINLTSFAKMRVDLAVQVLSETVANAIMLTGGSEAVETAKFVSLFDKFFDLLNVSNFTNGVKKRKRFQHPYRSGDDFRLAWLEEVFLPYLDSWEESVGARSGYEKAQRERMLLSAETRNGLRMTAKSFVGLTKLIFSLPEVCGNNLAFLSMNVCQDPVENFFGCQRQRGGTSDNPSVMQYYQNTQALRIVNSFCRAPVRGNCRGTKSSLPIDERSCTPLPKRQRPQSSITKEE